MSRRFTREFKTWLNGYIPGHTAREIQAAAHELHGVEMTLGQVKNYKQNNHIPSGTRAGLPAGVSPLFSPEMLAWLEKNHAGRLIKETTREMNAVFNTAFKCSQIRAAMKNRGWSCGVSCTYKKGHTPANKGTHPETRGRMASTQFKEGATPYNHLPVGAEVVRTDGYLQTKIAEPRVWRLSHVLNWEAVHGPIPDGCRLVFLDGNKQNTAVDNLALVSVAEHLAMNRAGLRFDDPELTRVGVSLAKLKVATYEAARGDRKK